MKDDNGKYKELSYDISALTIAYQDVVLFGETDCSIVEYFESQGLNGELLETRDVVCSWQLYQITECYCSQAGWYTSCYDCHTYYEYEFVCSGGYSSSGSGGGGGSSGSSGSGNNGYPNLNAYLTSTEYDVLLTFNLNAYELQTLDALFEQGVFQAYNRLNDCEKEYVLKDRQHAQAAVAIYENSNTAFDVTGSKLGNTIHHNDCGDAFRHAFWMALNARSTNSSLAIEYGEAHECDTPKSEFSEKQMDLWNNSAGTSIGTTYYSQTESYIANKVCDALAAGQLRILSDPNNGKSAPISSIGCHCN